MGRVDGGCGGEDGEEQKRNRFPMQMCFLRPKNMNESGASSIECSVARRHVRWWLAWPLAMRRARISIESSYSKFAVRLLTCHEKIVAHS